MSEIDVDALDARFTELLARAWDEGYALGTEDAGYGWRSAKNPYREQLAQPPAPQSRGRDA